MIPEKPDLNQASPEIRAYIAALETELTRLRPQKSDPIFASSSSETEEREPPTTINLLTVSRMGMIKRTPRHLYTRQRRGGMGVFDFHAANNDHPIQILTADENDQLILLTDFGNAYRFPVVAITATEVRSRGQKLTDLVQWPAAEQPVAIVSERSSGLLALVSKTGYLRLLRHNFVGPNLQPGTTLLDAGRNGPLAAVGWIKENDDVFIATRNGLGIRFATKKVSPAGSSGIRLEADDAVVGVCGVQETAGVFLMGADGKGTLRLMTGFRANKAPGAGGKVALKTSQLVGVTAFDLREDLFVISRLAKIIRFSAVEIPPKTGVVQGVHCISLRADEAVAIARSGPLPDL
jgi:DNA gyrase subunit A